MIKALLGIAPKQEQDGSFSPSKLALKLATSNTTDYTPMSYQPYTGPRSTILVIFTEQKNMTMKNGRMFSTGNHPVEALLPMLHLKNAGFDFEIVTPNGQPVVFEMWAMPRKDIHVMNLYEALKPKFEAPGSLVARANALPEGPNAYAAVFIPGGHGAMLGIPDDKNVSTVLQWAHQYQIYTITLCHGPCIAVHHTQRSGVYLCGIQNRCVPGLGRQTNPNGGLSTRPYAMAPEWYT